MKIKKTNTLNKEGTYIERVVYEGGRRTIYAKLERGTIFDEIKMGLKHEALRYIVVLLISMVLITSFLTSENMVNYKTGHFIDGYEEKLKNNSFVDSVATMCNLGDNDLIKIQCVGNYIKTWFVYNEDANRDGDGMIKPNELIFKGGVCRDFSPFYKVVMEKMNIDVDYEITETHMFAIAKSKEEGWRYAILDMNNVVIM